jgi:HlyD family secretion protein
MSSSVVDLGRVGRALKGLGGRLGHALRPLLNGRISGASVPGALRAVSSAARRAPFRTAALGAGVLAGAALGIGALLGRDPGVPLARVEEGPFHVAIVESGTLQALRSVTYASNIASNQAKIVALAPEGRLVQKGDLLILFDAAPFEEEIRKDEAQLAQAQADLDKAREDLKLQAIQNRQELAAAKQKLTQSELELKDVEDGKGRVKEEEAQTAVGDAERELQKTVAAAKDLRPLLAEGFITKMELDRADQQVAKAQADLTLAQKRRDALLHFGRPIELSQARSEALINKDGVGQLQTAGDYRLEEKKTSIVAAESRIQEAGSRLALARQQLARTEIRADVPGIVVYREVFFGSEPRKPQVGDQVWANQPLIILPDVSRMVVETKIRETDIHKVERNQKVAVRVEAYPDLKLTGRVTLIGTLAQEEKERRGTKFFTVSLDLGESDPRLRPGMTARVEIEVEERKDAVFVPLEAVFDREGRSVSYVSSRGRVEAREVVLGPSNRDFVVVERGLRKGERVCLREPGASASDFTPVSP